MKSLSLVKSTIGETAELGVYDNVIRTSTNTWIGPSGGVSHPHFVRVRERILNLTRLTEDTAEDIQVVHYSVGEHFFVVTLFFIQTLQSKFISIQQHHDYNDPSSCQTGYCRGGGNRIITVLFYLNDVEEVEQPLFLIEDYC